MILLAQDIIKTKIVSEFEKNWIETVTARVPTKICKDLTY